MDTPSAVTTHDMPEVHTPGRPHFARTMWFRGVRATWLLSSGRGTGDLASQEPATHPSRHSGSQELEGSAG